MRLTFEGQTLDHILDQMQIMLAENTWKTEKSKTDELRAEKAVLLQMAEERGREIANRDITIEAQSKTINAQRLRIEELEGHLAHAVGTKDLMLIQAPAKMPDSLKQAIASATGETDATMAARFEASRPKQRVSSTLLDDDVDKAAKPPKDMVEARRYPTGYWRLSDKQHSEMLQIADRFGQMPNGDWIVVIT